MCESWDDGVCECSGNKLVCSCGICQKCGRYIIRRH